MSILDVIGCRYKTEKASNVNNCFHNYLPFYETFLRHMRDEPITLLEIGVDKGNSLRMWRDYFQNGTIIGVDCLDMRSLELGDRITVDIADQNQEEDLMRVADKYGPFDVIVDDAGHYPKSQVFCHKTMIPTIKAGGVYILEDLVGNDGPLEESTAIDYLKQLAEDTITKRHQRIESVSFSYGTSVTKIRMPRNKI
jgi:hypothetical protein